MKSKPLLADIGNTHFHIYHGTFVEHLTHKDAIEKYSTTPLLYISVNHALHQTIASIALWKNISKDIQLNGAYETMGVDRKALCLSHEEGIFVDAGSAITVDVMQGGQHRGGFIVPGVRAMLQAYAQISPVLLREFDANVCLEHLPTTTKEGISYGIIAPIKAIITTLQEDKTLYITGGDGEMLSHFFEACVYDEKLVFYGMQKAIKRMQEC
jgi:type III pantothenate kinase